MLKKIKPLVIAVLFAITGYGCHDSCSPSANCFANKPYVGKMIIQLTINAENPKVPITIYEGDYEDKKIIMELLAESEQTKVDLPMDTRFTVAAEYKQGGKKILALDHARVSSDWYDCDECYQTQEGKVNVSIKNYFK